MKKCQNSIRKNNPVQYRAWESTLKPCKIMQSYHNLQYECLSGVYLFEDPHFPANLSSLYYSDVPRNEDIVWKRPLVYRNFFLFYYKKLTKGIILK